MTRLLKAAERDLEALRLQRKFLDRQIRLALNLVTQLRQQSRLRPRRPHMRMIDALRQIMASTDRPLRSTEVRDRLEAMGFDFAEYQNILSTLNSSLRRITSVNEDQWGRVYFQPIAATKEGRAGGHGISKR